MRSLVHLTARSCLHLTAAATVLGGVAHAQTAPGASKGYVEVVAQSAFGNVTSQSFGAEIGVTVAPRIQVFAEAGQVRDTSPTTLGTGAQQIAGFLARTQNNVG